MEHSTTPVVGFDPNQPWDFVIRQAVNDEFPKTMAWWNKELTRKCDGYINQTMSYTQVTDDGSTLLVSGPDWGKRNAAPGAKKDWTPKKQRKGGKGAHSPGGQPSGYTQEEQPQQRATPIENGWPKGDKGGKQQSGHDPKGKGKGQDEGKGKGKHDDKGKGKGD